MDESDYCAFCGRILRNEYSYCPFCGVQCKDVAGGDIFPADSPQELEGSGSHEALHKLQEMETALTSMEIELNVFLATKNV